jgi:hypothetical protein
MRFTDTHGDTNPLQINDITDVQALYAPVNRAWKTAVHVHDCARRLGDSSQHDSEMAQKLAVVKENAIPKAELEIAILKTLYHQDISIPPYFGEEHFRYWYFNLRDEVSHLKQLEKAGFVLHEPTPEQRAIAGVSFFIEAKGKYFPVIFEKSTVNIGSQFTLMGAYDTLKSLPSIRKFSQDAAIRMEHCFEELQLQKAKLPLIVLLFAVDVTTDTPTATALSQEHLNALAELLNRF